MRRKPLAAVVGENVRREREALGVTQPDLARRMTALGHGWGGGAVSRFESGKRVLRLDETLDVAYCLGLPLATLLDGAEDRHRAVVIAKGKRVRSPFTEQDAEQARQEERNRQTLYRTARMLNREPDEVQQALRDLYDTDDMYAARQREYEALSEDGSGPANPDAYRSRLMAAARKVREAIDLHLAMQDDHESDEGEQ